LRGLLFNLLKIAVSAGLIIFLLHSVNLDAMATLIRGANLLLLLLALGVYIAAIVIGVAKWAILLRAQKVSVPFSDLVAYSFAGLFFGNVLPSNVGGDLVRVYYLARQISNAELAAVSVLVDRLTGLTAYLLAAVVMAAVAALALGANTEMEKIVVATVIVFTVFICIFGLVLSRRVTRRLSFVFGFRLLAPFRPMAQRVFAALQVYRQSYAALAQAFVLALVIVVVASLSQWLISQSLGLGIGFFYFLLFNPLIAFVLLIPLSVNGIGLKEMAFVFFLGLVGITPAAALALSLVFHFIMVLASLPGGLVWFRERTVRPVLPGDSVEPAP
jgi:glycosyltransferase 2 family protein